MGINPKIGITGLPRSGKSAVLQKVVDMISQEGSGFRRTKGPNPPEHIIGGMRCEPVIENGERVGYACVNILTGEKGVMAHREICLLYTSPSPRDNTTSRMPSSA